MGQSRAKGARLGYTNTKTKTQTKTETKKETKTETKTQTKTKKQQKYLKFPNVPNFKTIPK